MNEQRPKLLFVLLAVLFIGLCVSLNFAEPTHQKIQEQSDLKGSVKSGDLYLQLPGQFIVASMTGFKEVIAGLLWIRADEFFHTGQYEAILPIVRMVTWLDPHNIDVFTTGAWHLDYNFVDEQQMSDKRYIPGSIALMKEAIANNPNIWSLYFELAWVHYNKKMMDYESGLEYMIEACKRDDVDINTGKKIPRPQFVDRMLAYQYEKLGRIDEAIEQMQKCRVRDKKLIEEYKKGEPYLDRESFDVIDRNLAELYLRKAWRYGDMEAYGKGVEIVKRLINRPQPPMLKWAGEGAIRDYEQRLASNNPPGDALKPLDTGFSVTWKKIKPRVLLISGKLNLLNESEYKGMASEVYTHAYQNNQALDANHRKLWYDGSRVHWKLMDYDYKMPELKTFNWNLDPNETVVWDDLYVSGGSFSGKIDLSNPKDESFYPLKKDKYKFVIWVTPIQPGVPDYVQDRIGWRGDALTDKNYLDTKTMPGFKMLRKEIILYRKDII